MCGRCCLLTENVAVAVALGPAILLTARMLRPTNSFLSADRTKGIRATKRKGEAPFGPTAGACTRGPNSAAGPGLWLAGARQRPAVGGSNKKAVCFGRLWKAFLLSISYAWHCTGSFVGIFNIQYLQKLISYEEQILAP